MQNIGKVVRAATGRAAAVGAATTAAAVAHPTAHARVQTAQTRRDASDEILKIQDDWLIPELNRDIVIFKPEELDRATEDVQALLAGTSQQQNDVSSDFSEGTLADSVIELADATRLPSPSPTNTAGMDILFRTANKLLQQPGMQQVVLQTMMNDPEIRDILVSQGEDLERFLQVGGIIPGGLLTGPDGSSASTSSAALREIQLFPMHAGPRAHNPFSGLAETDSSEDAEGSDEPNLLQSIFAAAGQGIGQGIEAVGEKLSSLGRWIRTKIGNVVPDVKDSVTGKPIGHEDGAAKGKGLDTVMGAVLTVAVAIVAVCVLRRPQAIGGLLRRMFAKV